MLKKIDSSHVLVKFLERLSTVLAKNRGLPVVVGIVLFVLGFALELLNIAATSQLIEVLQVILRNGGVLVALIGLLLAEPLGE